MQNISEQKIEQPGNRFFDAEVAAVAPLARGKLRISDEQIRATAQTYTELGAFIKDHRDLYQAARRRGLLQEVTAHMLRKYAEWSVVEMRATAQTYTEVGAFKKDHSSMYQAAQRRGLLKEVTGHMSRKYAGPFTVEQVRATAQTYTDVGAFIKDHPSMYQAVMRWGLLEELTAHMLRKCAAWSVEEVRATAHAYTELGTFRQNHPRMYDFVRRWNLLDELTAHLSRKGSRCLRCLYMIELEDEVYYGLSGDLERRFNEHRTRGKDSVRSLIERGGVFTILSEFMPSGAAAERETQLITTALAAGKRVLNDTRGGELGGRDRTWTPEAVAKVARKYETRTAFARGFNGAYDAARRMKILDEVCSHMPKREKGPRISNSTF